MTPAEIAAEFEKREKRAMKRIEGADHAALLAEVAADLCLPVEEVRRAVLDNLFTGPN